jgi:hypothetical protein
VVFFHLIFLMLCFNIIFLLSWLLFLPKASSREATELQSIRYSLVHASLLYFQIKRRWKSKSKASECFLLKTEMCLWFPRNLALDSSSRMNRAWIFNLITPFWHIFCFVLPLVSARRQTKNKSTLVYQYIFLSASLCFWIIMICERKGWKSINFH